MTKNFEKKILKEVDRKKIITTNEIASKLKVSWNTAERYLLELALQNKLKKIKKLRVNLWIKND